MDFWDVKASTDDGDPVKEVGIGIVEGASETQAVDEIEEDVVMVEDDPPV